MTGTRARRHCVIVLGLALTGLVRAQSLPEPPPAELARDPEARNFAALVFAQGRVAMADKDYAGALSLFEKAEAIYPADMTQRYFAGVCQLRLGRLDEAVASLSRTVPPALNRVPEARVRLDLGDAAYQKGDFARAVDELSTSVRLDGSDAYAHLYLGLALFNRDRQADALKELDRAAGLDPRFAQQRDYIQGVQASQRSDTAAARELFGRVLQGTSAGQAGNTREWLSALENQSGKGAAALPFAELRVGLSGEYDNNPGQINEVFRVHGNGPDMRAVIDVRAALNPVKVGDAWVLGLVFGGYGSRHGSFRQADLSGGQLLVQIIGGRDPLGYVNGPLGYARAPGGSSPVGFIFQGGTTYFNRRADSFRRDHEAAASVLVREASFGRTQLEALYTDREFFEPDPDLKNRSGHLWTFRLGQYFQLGGRPERYLRVAVARRASRTRARELNYDENEALAELALPLAKRGSIFLAASRSKDDYDKESLFRFGVDREDTRTEAGITAAIAIDRHISITGRYAYTRAHVNPDDFSYTRRVATLGVTYDFQ